MTNVYDELVWRGLVAETTDGLADAFAKERVTAYIGFGVVSVAAIAA